MALFQLQFVVLPITAAQNFLIASQKKSKNIKNWMFRGVTYACDMSKSVESKEWICSIDNLSDYGWPFRVISASLYYFKPKIKIKST